MTQYGGKGTALRHWLARRNGSWDCIYCHKPTACRHCDHSIPKWAADAATIEHVVPIARGGARTGLYNMTLACYSCNQERRDDPIDNEAELTEILRDLTHRFVLVEHERKKALDDIQYAEVRRLSAERRKNQEPVPQLTAEELGQLFGRDLF